MASTKVFVSSTYYDLKQVRGDIENFLKSMHYDPILHESGNIPYGKGERLENYCYKEIKNSDIVICIIGGKYGSESEHGGSITQNELKRAINDNKKVYIFVEDKVYTEFFTWQKNRDNTEIKYSYVDNPKIYIFLEKVYELPTNNQIVPFSKTSEIIEYLKEQWSGLFHEYLIEETKKEEISLAKELREQINNFSMIVDYLKENNNKVNNTLEEFSYFNNLFLDELVKILKLPKTIYIKSKRDLEMIMNIMSYTEEEFLGFEDYYVWEKSVNKYNYKISISVELFDENNKLKKDINEIFDKSKSLIYERTEIENYEDEEEEFPF